MTKVIGDYTAAISIDGSTNYLLIQPGNSSTAYNKINRNTLLGVSGQPADLTTVQTFSSKVFDNSNTITVKDANFTLQDDGDTTKQAQFQLSGITTGTTRTFTLPDASTTLVGTGATQTLTNKTLTSPTITGGTYDNGTITVDSIGGHTSANVVTVAGLQINNGALNTNNSVVTANITDGAVTPAKLLAGTGSGWSLQSYSPTWTNLTVGNGVNAFYYIQVGKLVFANFRFTLGSTSSVSANAYFSLPVTPSSHYNTSTSQNFIGSGMCSLGGTYFDARISINSVSGGNGQVIVINHTTNATYDIWTGVSGSIPGAWANGDTMQFFMSYEAA